MSKSLRCTAFVVAWCASFVSAQDLDVVPPPPDGADVITEVVAALPDPDLAAAAARHLDRHATEPAPSFEDALRDEDRDAALHAIQLGRTPALACLEALLLEERVRSFYIPPLDGDPLTLRVVSSQVETLVSTIEPLRFAYARCLATIERAPSFAERTLALHERAAELEQVHVLTTRDDLAAAHPAMLALVENAPELDWPEARELYVAAHGEIRADPEEERLEAWQNAAVITTSFLFAGSLVSMGVGVRIERVETGRYLLATLGVAVGTLPGVMLGRVWANPESEWTPHRLMAGALLTLGAIGGGIALFRSNFERRHQLFGATMAGGAVGNLVWLVGGLGVYRRQRRGLRGRPTVEISNQHGSLGWAGSF